MPPRVTNETHVIVPDPPKLALTPTRPNAVVTVAAGDEACRCLRAGAKHMSAYARRVGADFVICDWPGHPRWPMSSKYVIPRVLDHYERIVYLDADVLVRKTCPDLFSMVPPRMFGAVDELGQHRAKRDHREIEYECFRRAHGYSTGPAEWYFNAGVMVIPKRYAWVVERPRGAFPMGHCSEQDRTNAMALDNKIEMCFLPQMCNWQSWYDSDFRLAPTDAVLHWSSSEPDRRARRVASMEMYAAKFPVD